MGEEVWFGVVREWGGGVVRKQENKTKLYISITGESTTAYESVFDSNKLQSVLPTGKIRANSKLIDS